MDVAKAERRQGLRDHLAGKHRPDRQLAGKQDPGLVGQQSLEADAAVQVNPQSRETRQDPVQVDRSRVDPAGDPRGQPILRDGQGDGIAPGGLERRLAANLLQGLRCATALAVTGGCGENPEQASLGGRVVAELGQGGHGVAANLLRGIGEQLVQPARRLGLLLGRAASGEGHADRADDGGMPGALRLGHAIERDDVLLPETRAGLVAQLSVKLVVRLHA